MAVFVPLYFAAFAERRRPDRALTYAAAMSVMGIGLIPINTGGPTYVIFAVSIIAHIITSRRRALLAISALSATVIVVTIMTRHPFAYWQLIQPAVIMTVGGGNLLMAEERRRAVVVHQAREEVEHLAKVAERERIARDLHDLLGHTLSVIALKSELAAKIAATDPQRAALEIREVEQVSRQALTEVRHAVEGYRGRGLAGELRNARAALEAAGIALDTDAPAAGLSPRQETVLALALREAVTNVVRHSRATQCRVRVTSDAASVTLRVEDNGIGGTLAEGSGLIGMRERVGALGGYVEIDGRHGTRLTVTMPTTAAMEVAS